MCKDAMLTSPDQDANPEQKAIEAEKKKEEFDENITHAAVMEDIENLCKMYKEEKN